jgi:hypothetical protein
MQQNDQSKHHRPTHARVQAHWWSRLIALALVTASIILGSLVPTAQAQPTPSTILVTDSEGATSGRGRLFLS